MSAVKLTKSRVDAIELGDRDVFVWDTDLKGFGLRASRNGVMTFIAQYRAGGGRSGRTRRYTIGRFGAFTVEEARKQAKVILGAVANGRDPSGERTASRREMTVNQLLDQYEKEGAGHLKTREKRQRMARLRHHVGALLGSRQIGKVRVADIEKMMRDVATGKTRKDEKVGHRKRIIVRGGEGAAARAVRDLSAVFAFAVRLEALTANPCSPVKKPTVRRRKRYLAVDELKRLGAALQKLKAEGVNEKAIDITLLWALTGCRRNEIAGLKWADVDLVRRCLRLGDSKTGESHRALAAPALEILRGIARGASPYVFPSERGNSFYQGTKKIWPKLIKLAELPGITPHTLRHTVGSWSVSGGETLFMTGGLLGHTDPRSTAVYAHMQQHSAAAAADRVMAPIADALIQR